MMTMERKRRPVIATTLQGPAWSAHGLEIAAGRYPLSVERHVIRMAGYLVPGVTTVTPHARYFVLHALIAAEVELRHLSEIDAQDLLRRSEVALAAVSWAHEHGDTGLPRAHGTDALAPRLHAGRFDVGLASQPGKGGYASSPWGFWKPYSASEATLAILTPDSTMATGEACDTAAVRAGMGDILQLARQEELVVDDLKSYGRLCVCAGGDAEDGRWLARLMCADSSADPRSQAGTRRQTIQLITRVMQTHRIADVTADVGREIAFGDFLTTDEVARRLSVAAAWRGVILRNYSVGAWRRLWSWLVEQVRGLTPAQVVIDRFAAQMPELTVRAFLDELPPTQTPSGAPAPAEQQLRADSDRELPVRELSVLAVNAFRVDQLKGRALDAFLGEYHGIDLAPEWTKRRFAEAEFMSLRDFARSLAIDLLARARRVSLGKARRRPDGTLWLPTRLQERGDLLFAESEEGRGDVGLRLDELTTVLAGAGVVQWCEDTWQVTAAGQALLG